MIIGKKDRAYVDGLVNDLGTIRVERKNLENELQLLDAQYSRAAKRIRVLEQLVSELQLKAGHFIADVKDLCNEANGLTKGGK